MAKCPLITRSKRSASDTLVNQKMIFVSIRADLSLAKKGGNPLLNFPPSISLAFGAFESLATDPEICSRKAHTRAVAASTGPLR